MAGSIFQRATQTSVTEGNKTIQVEFVRSGSSAGAVSIQYGVDADTASPGVDYDALGGIVVMPDGASSVFVPITILDDDLSEETEVFTVSLISTSGAELSAPRTNRISILDDENPPPPPPDDPPLVPAYAVGVDTVITGLEKPINLAFVPTDEYVAYIGEKDGLIRVVDFAAGTVNVLLDLRPLINSAGDRGLMDVAVHPDFADNPYVYAFYMSDPPDSAASFGSAAPDGNGNRYSHLVRFTADAETGYRSIVPDSGVILLGAGGQTLADISGGGHEDFTDPSNAALTASDRVLDEDDRVIGGFKQDYLKVDSLSHAGGRMLFGPDGALYVFTGDGTSYDYPDPRAVGVQSLDSLSGKVLRIDPLTGQGYADNPFADSADDLDANRAKIFQYGMRNPFSAAFDGAGRLFIADVGWFSYEEINTAGPGANFGWPFFEGGDGGTLLQTPEYRDHPDAAAFYAAVDAGTTVITPAFSAFSHDSTIAAGYHMQAIISGAIVGDPGGYPASLAGRYLFSDFVGGNVYSINPNNPTDTNFLLDWPGDFGPIAMRQHIDGDIYYVDMGAGTIGRLEIADVPAEATASLSVTAETQRAPERDEGATPFIFNVTRTGDLGSAVSVNWKVAGALGAGTSLAEPADFVGGAFPSGTLSFAPDQVEATITVEVAGDAQGEFDKRFALALDEPSFGATIAQIDAVAVIENDDGGPAILSVSGVVAAEGSAEFFTEFPFTVTRSDSLFGTVSAQWSVAPATGAGANPVDAQDFAGLALPSGTVSFLPGQDTATIPVLVAPDLEAELDEGFTLILSNPSAGAEIDIAAAEATIGNDDGDLPSLAIVAASASAVEGDAGTTAFTFVVARSGNSNGASVAAWSVAPSGIHPADAADFASGAFPSGQVVFQPLETEQTVTVLVAGDTAVETHETFQVALSDPSAGTTIGTAAAAGMIVADDAIVDLAAIDGTTAQPIVLVPSFYEGPVAGLEKQLVENTSQSLTIATGGPNWFVHTGSGNDAIAATSGRNVLDGGTGSNFLTGGSGPDTFFVDARSPTAPIWSTVVGFGAGDDATMWGIDPSAFTLLWEDNLGVPGYTGLTVHAIAPGTPVASLTLAGYTIADKDSGTLLVASGFDSVSGSNYLYIAHA